MYVNVRVKDSEQTGNNSVKSYTVLSNTYSQAILTVEKMVIRESPNLSILTSSLIQSTMDIKASVAEYCYVISFYDKIGNITENYYLFTNDWLTVNEFVNSQVSKGWYLNSMATSQSEYIDGTM